MRAHRATRVAAGAPETLRLRGRGGGVGLVGRYCTRGVRQCARYLMLWGGALVRSTRRGRVCTAARASEDGAGGWRA